MTDTFPKRMRLLRPREFDRVFERRCSVAEGGLVVYASENDLGHPRLGLTVSRKVGRAVERNRWKRALREAFRLTQDELPALDLICLPRPKSSPDVKLLVARLPKIAQRLDRKVHST